MSKTKDDYINGIIELLNSYSGKIKTNSKLGKYDFNKACEDIFRPILNELFDLNLVNLNYIDENYPAIDLGDLEKKVCFQITSDSSKKKIKKTIDKFNKNNLNDDYECIYILNLGDKKSSYKDEHNIKIICFSDLIKKIQAKNDYNIAKNIYEHLEKNYSTAILELYNRNNQFENIISTFNMNEWQKFYNWMGFETEDDLAEFKRDVEKFSNEMNQLSKNARSIICTAIERCRIKDKSNIDNTYINVSALNQLYKGDKGELYDILEILTTNKNLLCDYFDSENICMLRFSSSEMSYCFLTCLYSYCSKYGYNFRSLIENLDYSILND